MTETIGIACTVHNRHETAKVTIDNIRKYAPEGAKIVIVDDASDTPYPDADYRFNKQAGIARAKNKCLELLEGCDHIFLLDDDCWPRVSGWHLPYVNSPYNHLMYIFGNFSNGRPNGNRKSKETSDAVIYENPCGCMLYYKRICIDNVGGMDVGYGIWGMEHGDLSTRIFNAGLTPYKFMDVKGSDELFYSYDKEQTIKRSVPADVRAKHIAMNDRKYRSLGNSAKYIPYKPERNLILTCYFTTLVDPQRGERWPYDPKACDVLRASVPDGVDFVCLSDRDGIVPGHSNPYLAKWIAFREYLSRHPKYDNVFMLDATDTEILINPFGRMERDKIYVGDEPSRVNNEWLKRHHPSYAKWIWDNQRFQLLNAGVIGGHVSVVMGFLNAICGEIGSRDHGLTDMALFNYVLRSGFAERIEHGRKITTVFKAFDKANRAGAWIRHK